jgi:hypothetical protein
MRRACDASGFKPDLSWSFDPKPTKPPSNTANRGAKGFSGKVPQTLEENPLPLPLISRLER